MLKIIALTEKDCLNSRFFVLGVDVKDENLDIEKAARDACKEYCLTEEGKQVYEGNCNNFNWGDFDIYVPDKICEKHGFKKVFLNMAGEFNFDEQFVDENDIFLEEDEEMEK